MVEPLLRMLVLRRRRECDESHSLHFSPGELPQGVKIDDGLAFFVFPSLPLRVILLLCKFVPVEKNQYQSGTLMIWWNSPGIIFPPTVPTENRRGQNRGWEEKNRLRQCGGLNESKSKTKSKFKTVWVRGVTCVEWPDIGDCLQRLDLVWKSQPNMNIFGLKMKN